MQNQELARTFNLVADAYELKSVAWKPAAYRTAASAIQNLDQSVAEIYKQGDIAGLEAIEGVGRAIAKHIVEYLETGRIRKLEKLLRQTPPVLSELLQIEGIGSSKARRLIRELKLTSITDLKAAARAGRVQGLQGFGAKTEQNILRAIETFEAPDKKPARRPLAEMETQARSIIRYLKTHAHPQRIDCAGSIRRRKETVGDIDILIQTDTPKAVMTVFTDMPGVERVLARGGTKSTVALENGIQVDLRTVTAIHYAAALLYLTGSKSHSIKLRTIARNKGYRLSEYGLFNAATNEMIHCDSEKAIYAKLGLKYLPPTQRE